MDSSILLWIIVASTFGLGLAGSLLAVQLSKYDKIWLHLGLGFGSGFLLAVAIAEMLPEAAESSDFAYLMALLGFSIAYFLEYSFKSTDYLHVHNEVKSVEITGLFSLVAISLHSIIDGMAIATALLSSHTLGMFVAAAVVVHKIPDGFALGSLLISKSYAKNLLIKLSLLMALATPIGAIISYFALKGVSLDVGIFLGLSAGTFIYISTAHMLQEAHHIDGAVQKQISSSFFVGIIFGIMPFLLSISL